MPTVRHSSIWDRWVGNTDTFTDQDFEDWLAINYPDAIARDARGAYISQHDNPRSWSITPNTLAEIAWLHLSGELEGLGGNTAAQNVQEYFSFSDYEMLQMLDIRDWILAQGTAANQKAGWNTLKSWMNAIEQHGIESKSFIYTKFAIRDDVVSG
jgi:hypothetical protein